MHEQGQQRWVQVQTHRRQDYLARGPLTGRIAYCGPSSGKVLVHEGTARLTPEERAQLLELLSKGKAAARTLTHARILLKADEGVAGPRLSDEAIADMLEVNRSTVERVRIRCVEEGFEAALRPRPSRQLHPRKLDGVQEAHLVTLACSPAPNGRGRWSLRLLADKLVQLEIVDGISHETVRQTLKKTN